jgi:polysaccharide biosynthesis/export protein
MSAPIARRSRRGVSVRFKSTQFKLSLLIFGLICPAGMAKAEYRLDAGDTLEIAVATAPELHRRVSVQLDGTISFPLIGTVVASGRTPSEVQLGIQDALAKKAFRTGRDTAVLIRPEDVTAVVVEYRPVYVNGDVSKPGEYPYRPFMTVHQAVALAGGYDASHSRVRDPFLDAIDLRSEYESLWTQFASEQAHVWRVRAELADKDDPDQKMLMELPVSKSVVSEFVSVELEQLAARQTKYREEKESIQRSIRQAESQIDVLSEQEKKEKEAADADIDELQKTGELFGRGLLPSTRVSTARQAVLLSATRKLQVEVQLMGVKKEQDDFERQSARLGDERKLELLEELREGAVRVRDIRIKLQAVEEKIKYTAALRRQLMRANGNKPEVSVVRKGPERREHLVADEETELQPGDVVEVALQSEGGVGILAH